MSDQILSSEIESKILSYAYEAQGYIQTLIKSLKPDEDDVTLEYLNNTITLNEWREQIITSFSENDAIHYINNEKLYFRKLLINCIPIYVQDDLLICNNYTDDELSSIVTTLYHQSDVKGFLSTIQKTYHYNSANLVAIRYLAHKHCNDVDVNDFYYSYIDLCRNFFRLHFNRQKTDSDNKSMGIIRAYLNEIDNYLLSGKDLSAEDINKYINNDNSEKSSDATSIQRHKYPMWINAFALSVIIIIIYSISISGNYFKASYRLKKGMYFAKKSDYFKAIDYYNESLSIVPDSKATKIAAAETAFLSKDDFLMQEGLKHLSGISLGKDEWNRLSAVMPDEYKILFKDVKK